jgi:hypothetical protein
LFHFEIPNFSGGQSIHVGTKKSVNAIWASKWDVTEGRYDALVEVNAQFLLLPFYNLLRDVLAIS